MKLCIFVTIICFFSVFLGSQLLNQNNTSEELVETNTWIIGWNDINVENDIIIATQLQSIDYCPLYDHCAMSKDALNWIKIEQSYDSYKEVLL